MLPRRLAWRISIFLMKEALGSNVEVFSCSGRKPNTQTLQGEPNDEHFVRLKEFRSVSHRSPEGRLADDKKPVMARCSSRRTGEAFSTCGWLIRWRDPGLQQWSRGLRLERSRAGFTCSPSRKSDSLGPLMTVSGRESKIFDRKDGASRRANPRNLRTNPPFLTNPGKIL
jgi:hypothetical protein